MNVEKFEAAGKEATLYHSKESGRKIIEYLINDAKERGTEKIFLESSGVAKKLYHEIGFADMEDYMKLEDQQYADQRN